tara:strand:+ start:580 stop:723 length:144 start_codon:yes stop_codon:yes gene_type:complete
MIVRTLVEEDEDWEGYPADPATRIFGEEFLWTPVVTGTWEAQGDQFT